MKYFTAVITVHFIVRGCCQGGWFYNAGLLIKMQIVHMLSFSTTIIHTQTVYPIINSAVKKRQALRASVVKMYPQTCQPTCPCANMQNTHKHDEMEIVRLYSLKNSNVYGWVLHRTYGALNTNNDKSRRPSCVFFFYYFKYVGQVGKPQFDTTWRRLFHEDCVFHQTFKMGCVTINKM